MEIVTVLSNVFLAVGIVLYLMLYSVLLYATYQAMVFAGYNKARSLLLTALLMIPLLVSMVGDFIHFISKTLKKAAYVLGGTSQEDFVKKALSKVAAERTTK
jgi:ABC-type phosphate transport system permease subunit